MFARRAADALLMTMLMTMLAAPAVSLASCVAPSDAAASRHTKAPSRTSGATAPVLTASGRLRSTTPAAATCTGFAVSFVRDAIGEATPRNAVAAFLGTDQGAGYARPASAWTQTRHGPGFEFRSGTEWLSVVALRAHTWAVDAGRCP